MASPMPGPSKQQPSNTTMVSMSEQKKSLNTATTMPIPGPSIEDYTIGWICALQEEYEAACRMLDEEFDGPETNEINDNNTYTLGRIDGHSVVIGCLPDGVYGASSAAIVARDMVRSFPNLKFALMVGIGGGAPTRERDIRLGDVVVSAPRGAFGGVVQYDLGKRQSDGRFQRTGQLNAPPTVLLGALPSIKRHHNDPKKPDRIAEHLKLMDDMPDYRRPAQDQLFRADYDHRDGKNCSSCEVGGLEERPLRFISREVIVHYGTIASANSVMKDAAERDRYAQDPELNVLCFEMEAAGLMNNFPCLVIRGVCDYSDSHKNDEWHKYAALTAAAYARELLYELKPQKVSTLESWAGKLAELQNDVREIHSTTSRIYAGVDSLNSDGHLDKLKKWLSPPDPSTNLNTAKEKRHEGTGGWFIDSAAFVEWKLGSRRHLWLHGLAGCGKTVLTSTILDHLQGIQTDSYVCLDFFFDFRDQAKQHLDNLLRSLAFQLYSRCIDSQQELNSLFASHEDGKKQPTTESLSKAVHLMMQRPHRLQIILDALDECTARSELLNWMETLSDSKLTNVYFIATSRREEELESRLGRWMDKENMIPLNSNLVNADIRSYTEARLRQSSEFMRWTSKPDVLKDIESVIGRKSNGMFRWAVCQLDNLEHCLDKDELQSALDSLPQDLNETYSRILTSIPEGRREKAVRILQFLIYSERPLTVEEAVDVIAIPLDPYGQFDQNSRLPRPNEITRLCSSLVSLVTTGSAGKTVTQLELAHFSVKEYLISTKLPEPFRYKFSEPNSRGSITRSCLAYLTCIKSGESITNIAAQFPLAKYSAKYWMDHAKHAETLNNVIESIMDFFQNSTAYTTWGHLFNAARDWNEHPEPNTIRPLYFASLKGLNTVVQALLEKGADVNAQGGFYGNALQAAFSRGHDKIVQMLLEKGADVNAQGGLYGNALQAASDKGHDKIVQMLLEKGADVNAQGGFYGNALQAASDKGHDKIVQMLLEKGADVNAQGGEYGNALHAASSRGHDKIVQMLLEKGADVNAQGGFYGNALHAASDRGHDKIVQMLLEKGADVNAQGGRYGNALHAASDKGHDKIVQMLLEKGADVNAQGGEYGNALHAASQEGHDKIVQMLLEKGADVNAQG
ncbi:Pfs, NACHT and ankyrin domain protein, partial [Lasiosphaeria miniovina]